MSSGVKQARRLVEHGGGHPVISLYLDLDPERFATPPARESQIRSLVDEASRRLEDDDRLDHEDLMALREDLQRVEEFLTSDPSPFRGARALALFCSGRDRLFESIPLSRPVPGRVVIDRSPYVEPMLEALEQRRWLVALANRRTAWLLSGSPEDLHERTRVEENVHGQHDQGGWSQARYERSVEKDVEDHLRNFAEVIERRWREEGFDRLAVGGPQELVPRLVELLGEELRARLAPERVEVDLSSATESDVRQIVERLVVEDDRRSEREALDRLGEGQGTGRAARGLQDTLEALNERRVEQLLLDPAFDPPGHRCPVCGLLLAEGGGCCPADGTALEPVEHLREAVVEAALVQDAAIRNIRHHEDLRRPVEIAALLRF